MNSKPKILILNLPGLVLKAGSRWYNTRREGAATLKYYPYPWFMGYATALLKKNGFNTVLKDAVAMEWSADETIRYIRSFNPDYLICEPTWISIHEDAELLSRINKKIIKIAVGNYATNYPYECLEKSHVNYVAVNEYEFSLLEFFKSNQKKLPQNFISKNKRDYSQPNLVDLDSFPFPERDDTPIKYYNEPSSWGKNIVMVSSRGCRLKCDFCNVECIYGSRLLRARSAKNVVDEMEYLNNKYDFDEIYFDDDNMIAKKGHVEEICREILKRKLKIKWLCMGDGLIDLSGDNTLKLMAQAGCVTYKFGLEHLDAEVLRAIPKPLSKERSLGIIKKCRNYGLKSYANLIIGLPKSTWNKDLDMMREVIAAKPDLLQIAIATPYPGTTFFHKAKENGWLISENPGYFDATGKSAVSYPDYPAEKIEEMFHLAWKMWYKHVLFNQPKTLLFFITSEIRRNGLLNTGKKMFFYLTKIIKN